MTCPSDPSVCPRSREGRIKLTTEKEQKRSFKWLRFDSRVRTVCKFLIDVEDFNANKTLYIEFESKQVKPSLAVAPGRGVFDDRVGVYDLPSNQKVIKKIQKFGAATGEEIWLLYEPNYFQEGFVTLRTWLIEKKPPEKK